jgi:hypothetical protein
MEFRAFPMSGLDIFGYLDKDKRLMLDDTTIKQVGFYPVFFPDRFYNELNSDKRYDVWIGGNGSGKSTAKALQLLLKAMNPSIYFRCLFVRMHKTDIRKSVYQTFKDVAKFYKLEKYFRFYNGTCDIFCYATGHWLYSSGLDDTGKLSGINDVTDIWFEEPITISNGRIQMATMDDFDNLNARLRTPLGKHKIHFTLNPISKEFFLYKHLLNPEIEEKDLYYDIDDFSICYSNFEDNPFLPDDYVKKVIMNWKGDRAVYGREGKWVSQKTGKEWIYSFRRDLHTKPVFYAKDLPVHLTFDFNIQPYQTMLCIQVLKKIVNDKEIFVVRVFREYCSSNPNNYPEYAPKTFIKQYIKSFGAVPLYFYGDASGKNGANAYRGIENTIKPYLHNLSNQVPNSNPFNEDARDFLNEVFSGEYAIEVEIDEKRCPNLIKDLEELQEGTDGYNPEVKTIDGSRVETKGHCFDAFKYFMYKYFKHLHRGSK